jgi:hypothetical protein
MAQQSLSSVSALRLGPTRFHGSSLSNGFPRHRSRRMFWLYSSSWVRSMPYDTRNRISKCGNRSRETRSALVSVPM